MIEFTILLDDSPLQFEPIRDMPELAFLLPPTARIGRNDDVVHLAPIPVHCFFNAITFGHWLVGEHSLSENDAFVVYSIHDMFKSLLQLMPRGNSRSWWHQYDKFDGLDKSLEPSDLFDDRQASLEVAARHGERRRGKTLVPWREAVAHETRVVAGIEEEGKSWEWDWPMIGLSMRLQTTLSNAQAIAHVKRLFVEAYVAAIRKEFSEVFSRFDAVSYEYEFVDPSTLTGDLDKDIEELCQRSKVYLDGRRLVVHTHLGATGPSWSPASQTRIHLPFWLLLTLRQDPTSLLFPVPVHYDDKTENRAFVESVKDGFYTRIRSLLDSVPVGKAKASTWPGRVDKLLAHLDEAFPIIHTREFDRTVDVADYPEDVLTDACALCGSVVPSEFICSPTSDLGWSASRYTDWHIGDAERACMLCAISNFKVPAVLKPARRLVFQRKLVYLAVSTPGVTRSELDAANLVFASAPIDPQLEITSLESLVTLNIAAALYLHDALRRTVLYQDDKPALWLEDKLDLDPFAFVGEIATARSKARMPSYLVQLHESLSRPVVLMAPLLPMEVEVPFHALACVWGTSRGRHFELKYKPLIVSNKTAAFPIVWEGYHILDRDTLSAIQELDRFVKTFRSRGVSHRMKLTALADSPQAFIHMMIEVGGYGYKKILRRLQKLSKGDDPLNYLLEVRSLVRQTPLANELWG